jgi:dCMP deaminase
MIIGITGTHSAGKGTIADILVSKGFKHYSVRDFLVEEIKRRGIDVNRDNMVLVANDMRQQNSPSYIVEEMYRNASADGGDIIIESLRTPGEIMSLRDKPDFHMVAIDADPKTRYRRVLERGSATDQVSFEKFLDDELREIDNIDPAKQNLKKCIEMSELKLMNDGTVEELRVKVEQILKDIQVTNAVDVEKSQNISENHIRPSWDEYFMSLAELTGSRGTCDRGRSGCVVVRDKHILVGGYVGSPRGLPHCDEVGHLMKTVVHEDGTESRHCLRTAHAEQNAICQAAKLGIAIEGSTIYVKMTPCAACAKMIINAGIIRVVCARKYHAGSESEGLFDEAGVELEILDNDLESYVDQ